MTWTAVLAVSLTAHGIVFGVPGRASLGRVTEMARASVIFDHRDRPAFTIYREQRLEIPLDQMSPHLRSAIVAVEDQRFYSHRGVDVVRLAGAAVANLRERRAAQGGSTITQQLARLSFLTPAKTVTRKLQEIVLASLLETEYSKDHLLELYLNKVYFGAGLYGVEAASLGYFGKHAAEVTVAEAALIAGLVKAPSSYAPTTNLSRAVARRALVLEAMVETGVIDRAAFEHANTERVVLRDALNRDQPYGRSFKDYVRGLLVARFGEPRVNEGGLRVYTTMDPEVQKAADHEVERAVAALDRRRLGVRRQPAASMPHLQAALVALDPRTGEVRALVGGRDFTEGGYNRAVHARRQPGSAFKPFVFAAALEAGYTPASLIDRLDEPIDTFQGAWLPDDHDQDPGAVTMREALRASSNRAAVRMAQQVGLARAVAYATRMGLAGMPAVPSVALGAGEVTLESLTTAYGVFASGGLRRTPVYIRRVEEADGTVLYTSPYESAPVVSPQAAFLMSDMLADVVDHGTAWRTRDLGFTRPAAGKTGTTNDYRDAWFVGYTPRLVTGVWIGFDQPQPIMRGGYASEVAVPLWASFMRRATARDPVEWFSPPRGIVSASICRLSGLRAVDGCHDGQLNEDGVPERVAGVINEYFVTGTEPVESCSLHRLDTQTTSSDEEEAEDGSRRGFWGRMFRFGRNR
ncbi:MAG: penicillin-binding protein 1A [Acidobacteriota bacterium]